MWMVLSCLVSAVYLAYMHDGGTPVMVGHLVMILCVFALFGLLAVLWG